MYELTDKEFDAVLQLNADYRQAHFKEKVREQGGLYILIYEDAPYTLEDTEEDDHHHKSSILPVWCHERYAVVFAENAGLNGARAQLITAEAWNKSWVPPLLENKALLGFMPLRDDDFAVDDPAKI
ncbi:MAG: DUF2750 domain-containing protein [Succinivibrio sp.]|nr:DUF2750 domain-containing protein [Succinivibrio sp.]